MCNVACVSRDMKPRLVNRPTGMHLVPVPVSRVSVSWQLRDMSDSRMAWRLIGLRGPNQYGIRARSHRMVRQKNQTIQRRSMPLSFKDASTLLVAYGSEVHRRRPPCSIVCADPCESATEPLQLHQNRTKPARQPQQPSTGQNSNNNACARGPDRQQLGSIA